MKNKINNIQYQISNFNLHHLKFVMISFIFGKEYLNKFDEVTNTNISNLMKKTGIKLKKYLTKKPHGKLCIF